MHQVSTAYNRVLRHKKKVQLQLRRFKKKGEAELILNLIETRLQAVTKYLKFESLHSEYADPVIYKEKGLSEKGRSKSPFQIKILAQATKEMHTGRNTGQLTQA